MRCLFFLIATLSVQAGSWSTSRIQGSPEPGKSYLAEQVYQGVRLESPVDMVPLPGAGKNLVCVRDGQVWALSADPASAEASLWLDVRALHPEMSNLFCICFHPRYAENGYVFLTWVMGDKVEHGSKLARYRVRGKGADARPDPSTEKILLTWRSGGHNGASMQFGPDGMLYLSTGDAEVPAPPDPLSTGQRIDDLLSSILRIDIDHVSAGLPYSIPADNPFLHRPGARGEVWAYGLRNPWKISFDRKTGRLWCGDVGWELWEMIHLIQKGGNYGWCAVEATQQVRPQLKSQDPISAPIVAHSHTEAASITGGYVYRGHALPELRDAYVYGDYETGKIWALWYDGQRITRHEEICDTPLKIVSFGEDEAGELYFLHYAGEGSIHRLRRNPQAGQPSDFPRLLSQTGLFHPDHSPQHGVEPYSIHTCMWQDGATAQRYVAVPKDSTPGSAKTSVNKEGKVNSKSRWEKGAVFAKTLSLGTKRVETQMLHFDGDAWQGYSYRWNDAGTDAELVAAQGDEQDVALGAGKSQRWRFHSRAECMRCHTMWTGYLMGFQPQQLKNAEHYVRAGIISPDYLQQSMARCVNSADEQQSTQDRARSWLHANCAHCHREAGGGSVPLWLNLEMVNAGLKALDQAPTRGDMGLGKEGKVIAPGSAGHSVLLHRLARTGAGHMPIIGSSTVDAQALLLLREWITQMNPAHAEGQDAQARARDWLVRAEAGGDDLDEAFGVIISSSPAAALELAAMAHSGMLQGAALERTLQRTLRADSAIRELFECFRPESERVATLGLSASAEKILAKAGDAARGAALLVPEGKAATCLACHFIKGMGRDFGPDLTQLAARADQTVILQSLLAPSAVIAPGFSHTLITLKDGSLQSGFVLKRETETLSLKIATGQTLELPLNSIQTEQPLPVSLMPEGLLQNFTAQEAADLLAYLKSLR